MSPFNAVNQNATELNISIQSKPNRPKKPDNIVSARRNRTTRIVDGHAVAKTVGRADSSIGLELLDDTPYFSRIENHSNNINLNLGLAKENAR